MATWRSCGWYVLFDIASIKFLTFLGITVGAVVVPQSMAYAGLAQLKPEFGLYSSFMGVLIYWFFATSKDITIGPVAVLSTVTGNVILSSIDVLGKKYAEIDIATSLAIVCGSIVLFFGLTRLGWIVELISLPAICAFMTGSALNIAVGQVPALMGIDTKTVNNRDSTYLVVIHVLQHLNASKLDAAMGLSALLMLYLIRSACNLGASRIPNRKKNFFFLSTLRTAFVILLYTLTSWLVNKSHTSNPSFKILGVVPRGFTHAQVPTVNAEIIKSFSSQIPVTVIVMLIEHIAISKSFGRINNYQINPSQELVAIGVTNVLGPFLGAYPATGSFSRTAIKSKAGVRTPFAGVITALVVLLAIYALTAVFFYIPSASLSAVIIHAVGDLITPPNVIYQFWRVNPFEVLIFFAGVFVTVFTNIENGIYTTVVISMAVFLFRVFKAQGRFLGKVKVHSVLGDHVQNSKGQNPQRPNNDADAGFRNVFLPIAHGDGSNPAVEVKRPYSGIFIYRFSEGYNYPNANHYLDFLVDTVFQETRRTNQFSYPRLGVSPHSILPFLYTDIIQDRPWNDPGPRRGQVEVDTSHLPTLKAIILDFASVNNVDVTSVQHLIDIRNQLDRYASPNRVDWHFAHINNRWTKRALMSAGFGYPSPIGEEDTNGALSRWKPIFSVAEIGGKNSAAAAAESQRRSKVDEESGTRIRNKSLSTSNPDEIHAKEIGTNTDARSSDVSVEYAKQLADSKSYGQAGKIALIQGLNRPLFHIDLTTALQSAIKNAEELEGGGSSLNVKSSVNEIIN